MNAILIISLVLLVVDILAVKFLLLPLILEVRRIKWLQRDGLHTIGKIVSVEGPFNIVVEYRDMDGVINKVDSASYRLISPLPGEDVDVCYDRNDYENMSHNPESIGLTLQLISIFVMLTLTAANLAVLSAIG